ncbi:hypothetical protein PMAYCL1PPCAC_07923, partial [Pristionchus mayeri]
IVSSSEDIDRRSRTLSKRIVSKQVAVWEEGIPPLQSVPRKESQRRLAWSRPQNPAASAAPTTLAATVLRRLPQRTDRSPLLPHCDHWGIPLHPC